MSVPTEQQEPWRPAVKEIYGGVEPSTWDRPARMQLCGGNSQVDRACAAIRLTRAATWSS